MGQPHPQDASPRASGRAQGSGPAVILASSAGGLPASTNADDLRGRDRLGRGQAPVGGALGGAGNNRGRVDPDSARRGGHRRAHLRRDAPVRHRSGRPVIVSVLILAGSAILFSRRAAPRWAGGHRSLESMIASIVDTDALLTVVWVSLLAESELPRRTGSPSSARCARLELGRSGAPGNGDLRRGRWSGATTIAAIVFGIFVLSD